VPSTPGGSYDFTARIVTPKLAELMGQPIVVENRGGADSIIGTQAGLQSAPDGYTVMLVSSLTVSLTPSLHKRPPYDPLKDFDYIGHVSRTGVPPIFVVNPKLPANNFEEFVQLAKSKPGAMNYGSYSAFSRIQLETLGLRAGMRISQVPYRGPAEANRALLAGEVDIVVANASLVAPAREGRMRALAVGGSRRAPELPNVPALAELGINDDIFQPAMFGFAAPAGIPAAVTMRLSADTKRTLETPEVAARLAKAGLAPYWSSPEDMAELIRRNAEHFAGLVKAAGIQPE
jgi:tripartite-type tricarboxylate transporter receptor subunit TctC